MSRRLLTFTCEGQDLAATLDEGPKPGGLLLVTGGNELRSGAFAGQAELAARIAADGHSVFRFDRRGVGDSAGENGGYRSSAPDIAAALTAFRAQVPGMSRVVGFGNCDAASALMLSGGAGLDALVLSNPWTFEDDESDNGPPPEAIRSRYAEKLKNPRELVRLVTGKVSFAKLAKGLIQAIKPPPPPTSLAEDMRAGLDQFGGDVRILLAGRDRTGQAFAASWPADDSRIHKCQNADHAYSDAESSAWLEAQLLSALAQE